jgi:hypothetical protein
MSSPGVEPGLSRPRRDGLAARPWGNRRRRCAEDGRAGRRAAASMAGRLKNKTRRAVGRLSEHVAAGRIADRPLLAPRRHSAAGTRTRVHRARAEYPSPLDYSRFRFRYPTSNHAGQSGRVHDGTQPAGCPIGSISRASSNSDQLPLPLLAL